MTLNKNGIVRDHYPQLGFVPTLVTDHRMEFELGTDLYEPLQTKIRTMERSYDSN